MRSLLQKLRRLTSKHDQPASETDSFPQTRSSKPLSIRYLYFSTKTNYCVQLELLPSHQLIRVSGVDTSLSCLDFTVKLTLMLGLQPSSHLLMVPNLNFIGTAFEDQATTPRVWQRAPSNSKLSDWLKPLANTNGTTNADQPRELVFGSLRLVHKTCVKNALRSGILETYLQNASNHLREEELSTTKSGRELLDELGTRILVHLPVNRKLVIRANLNRPVFEAVAEVCALRNLVPNQYYLQNAHTGAALDPLLSFRAQHTTEFELKECDPIQSNLACLVKVTDPIQWPDTSADGSLCLIVKPRVSTVSDTAVSPRHQSSPYSQLPEWKHSADYHRPTSMTSFVTPKTIDHTSLTVTIPSPSDYNQPSYSINTNGRRKRRAPLPPSQRLRTVPHASPVVLSHSLRDLNEQNWSSTPMKSSSFSHLRFDETAFESRSTKSTRNTNGGIDSKINSINASNGSTNSGLDINPRSHSVAESRHVGAQVLRAHTLPRVGTNVCPTERKATLVNRSRTSDACDSCVKPDGLSNSDHIEPGKMISAPSASFLAKRHSRPRESLFVGSNPSRSDVLGQITEQTSGSSKSNSDMYLATRQSETPDSASDPLPDSLMFDDDTPQVSPTIPIVSAQGNTNPSVAPRPSKAMVATYFNKRSSMLPTTANTYERPESFLKELTQAVSKVRMADS